jgi:hypothetical protein
MLCDKFMKESVIFVKSSAKHVAVMIVLSVYLVLISLTFWMILSVKIAAHNSKIILYYTYRLRKMSMISRKIKIEKITQSLKSKFNTLTMQCLPKVGLVNIHYLYRIKLVMFRYLLYK